MPDHSTIADIRKVYKKKQLDEHDVVANPIEQFGKWWDEAVASHLDEVNAMTLATCNKEGKPSARIVLLKGIHKDGFVFFTNYQSRKGRELEENPNAALLFFWEALERQVRVEGKVSKISPEESDEYFKSRPLESRIGAWTSPQSKVIPDRHYLDAAQQDVENKFKDTEITRPEFWGGYIVIPDKVEFWQGRPGRLHDRLLYTRENNHWKMERLAP